MHRSVRMVGSELAVEGKILEVRGWEVAGARETIVLIHEALGSASYWKDFPEKLAESNRCNIIAYSRAGHGESLGPVDPRSREYYEFEVDVVLPNLKREFGISDPILYGHSEGAVIALLYAAAHNPTKAIVAESPIVVREEGTRRTVEQMNNADARGELVEKLGRYHKNAEAVFSTWLASTRVPLDREFPASDYLPRVQCPVLVIQGKLDPFGGPAQWEVLRTHIPLAQRVLLADAGHLPHREQTEAVIDSVTRFLTPISEQGRTDRVS